MIRDRAALAVACVGALGVIVSAYLAVAHYSGTPLACVTSALIDCTAVTSSSYSLVPFTGIPISLAGLVWSAASLAAGLVALRGSEPSWLRPAHLAWSAAAMAVVLSLIRAEIVVIGRICEWCTVLHVLIAATFFLALWRMRETSEDL